MELSRCSKSGASRYASIPIASAEEHRQAIRFTPENPANCVVYVVRDHDYWTGGKVRRATCALSKQEQGVPTYPSKPVDLPLVFDFPVLGVYDHIYSMWEIPSGTYILQAFIDAGYWAIPFAQVQGRVPENLAVMPGIQCAPGELYFFTVGDRGFSHTAYLRQIEPEIGKSLIRGSLRAAGRYDGAPGYRGCEDNR